MVREAGLEEAVEAESAGTGAYHVGGGADPRSVRAARRRGYDLSRHCARQVRADDFGKFDYVLAMDRDNLRDLQSLCSEHVSRISRSTAQHERPPLARVAMLLDFAPQLTVREVPDPYARADDGFDFVIDIVEDAARGLLEHILANPA